MYIELKCVLCVSKSGEVAGHRYGASSERSKKHQVLGAGMEGKCPPGTAEGQVSTVKMEGSG